MGFYFYACMWSCSYNYGAPFGGPSGRRSSAIMFYFPSPWWEDRVRNYFENILEGARLVECYPQGPHEMGSCREEEKRKAEIGMEKISGKRTERGWLGLKPDPTVDSWQEHYQERSIKGVMCYLCTKRISMCVCRLLDSRAVSILPNCSTTTVLQYYNSLKTFEEIKRNT